jgi:hypothetical protein
MKRALPYAAACLLLGRFISPAADGDFYGRFVSQVGTNDQWIREIDIPTLIDTNNTSPKLTKSKLSEVALRPQVTVAGIRLGMTMDQVVAIWGKPRGVSLAHAGAPRLSYRDSLYPDSLSADPPYAVADVFFHPGTNSVMAIWVTFPRYRWDGKPTLSPKAEECLGVLGEPTARNYIPDPFVPRKQAPKHWYCRMIYRQAPVVLYFADGELMGLEVNPRAKGVAPEGQGSDDYSIQFCLE